MKKRLAGLLIPAFALRHANDLGIGDTYAMREALKFCADNGISMLQILPINETGADNSPYNAISSVALDPVLLYMAPIVVPGLTQEILNSLLPGSLLQELQHGAINYPRVKALKEQILLAAYDQFENNHIKTKSPQAESFVQFETAHNSWLPAYTLFRTLMKEHNGNACWTQWETELQTYEGAKKWLSTNTNAIRLQRYRRFYSYVQWVAFSQWISLKDLATTIGVELMGDIPFGVSRYSADVWSQRQLFDLEWSGGAPPEPLFKTDLFTQKWGQNWGIPLYKWAAHKNENFAWWRQRVHRIGDFFHAFRIDHVLGFFRIYAFPWIPERNGEFVNLSNEEAAQLTNGRLPQFLPHPDQPEELAKANAEEGKKLLQVILEAAQEIEVVAEDLGMVPDYVRPILKELGIAGFYIPQFERSKSKNGHSDQSYKPKENIPELSLSTYATHDHEPLSVFYERLVEWWLGPNGHEGWLEVQRLMRFIGMDENHPPKTFTNDLHKRLLEVLLASKSKLVILMITDLLLTKQRFNAPGEALDSNWSQRLDRPLSAYAEDPVFGGRIKMFSELIKKTGRLADREKHK